MSGFRTLAKMVLISVLLAAGCTPSLDAKSMPGTTSPPMVVEGVVESVSLPGWVFLSESATGIETIKVTDQTRLADSRGNSTTLCALQAGQSIQATGETWGRSLTATRITVQVRPTRNEEREPPLSATLEMPSHLANGKTVDLKFTLTNNSEAGLYVLKWYTPLERFGGEIFCVQRDGQPVPYRGPEAERGDPTPDSYVYVEAGASLSATVDLAAVYDFSKPGVYCIAFVSPRMSHLTRTEGEMAASIYDLGPVAMPSSPVSVTILEDL